jgi:hypothetical protein
MRVHARAASEIKGSLNTIYNQLGPNENDQSIVQAVENRKRGTSTNMAI